MGKWTILILCLTSVNIHGQEVKTEFDGHTWKAPYDLPIPEGWGVERFPIPIIFAPRIPYKGVEDIRFSPGWAKMQSEEYWTYAFLWYLEDTVKTNEKIIAQNLELYYTGLIRSNTDSTKTRALKTVPVSASFKKTASSGMDLETYMGSIEMMDYMQQRPITLYCKVHLKVYGKENRNIIFYELSPKPFTHNNWLRLDQLWSDFK